MPAVARDRRRVVLTVRDFGANGDGSNQRTQIQAAIDHVSAAGGGVLRFPAGLYGITDSLFIKDGVTLIGDGAGASIIRADASMPGNPMIRTPDPIVGGLSDFGMVGMELDGNRSNRTGVVPNGHGWVSYAVQSNPNRRVRVERCYVHNCPGLSLINQNVDGLWVSQNQVANSSRDGISSYYVVRNAFILNNHIWGVLDDFIAINPELPSSDCRRIVIAGNVCGPSRVKESYETYFGSGITIRGGQNISVYGNQIQESLTGISCGTTPHQNLADIVIAANTVNDPGKLDTGTVGHGITVSIGEYGTGHAGTGDRIMVVNNTIRAPRGHGIQLRSGTSCTLDDTTIRGNVIDMAGSTSVTPTTSSRGIQVTPTNGTTDLIIDSNMVRNAPSHGIFVGDGTNTTSRLRITGNTVLDSGRLDTGSFSGIYIQRCSGFVVNANQARDTGSGNQDYGFTMVDVSGVASIYGNDFSGNVIGELNTGGVNTATWMTTVNVDSASLRGGLRVGQPFVFSGSGSPEGVVTAPVGSLYLRTDGGAGTSLYVKQSGTSNTGWVGK